jgi:hypothetical protein
MYIRTFVEPVPGIEARRPTVSGFVGVSQRFTVAHSRGLGAA